MKRLALNNSEARPSSVISVLAGFAAAFLVSCSLALLGCQADGRSSLALSAYDSTQASFLGLQVSGSDVEFSLDDVPEYSGKPSVEVNGNTPFFTEREITLEPMESFSDLDDFGRCGVAMALVGPETMPTENRGSIGMIKPSGWQISEYDWIDGGYLFNRCHLIAFALTGENDNPLNLITGTRTMNAQGMLPYEERVASYVNRTGNHVLYRVAPVFEGDNLVASGVLMEALSVEDAGSGICFCVWCYNVEPGVVIDYGAGNNRAGDPLTETYDAPIPAQAQQAQNAPGDSPTQEAVEQTFVLNTNTRRFHYPDCPSVAKMKEKNKKVFEGSRDEAISEGYSPCGVCKP